MGGRGEGFFVRGHRMASSDFSSLPVLGAGVGLRKNFFTDIFTTEARVGWLEIIPENFMNFGGYPLNILDECAKRWPIVSHGVNLSIGSCDPLNENYLHRLKALLDRVNAPWFSDHICFTSVGGDYFHDLIALPFSNEAVEHVAKRVKQVKKKIGRPFLLENPSYYVKMPGAEMEESAFITAILERADCGLMLDVNNVYVNSRNHGYDPYAFMRRLPLHRVGQIHLAGHHDNGDTLVDTHEGPIIDPVWKLYEFTMGEIGRPVSTLIEWDTNVPPLETVLEEARRADKILGVAAPERRLRLAIPKMRPNRVLASAGEAAVGI
jgi:uncharacterized protein (UPF0276 family)